MASKRKTRLGSITHMSHFIGTGQDLLPSELPTLRDVLRYGLLLRQQSDMDARNYPASSVAEDIFSKVIEMWRLANSAFVSPVLNSKTTILKKIKDNWGQAKNIALGRGKLETKEAFILKLDKLFDILNCKCKIVLCCEAGCPTECQNEVHIQCSCPRDMKIPRNELCFIKGQREKVGSTGSHQIGLPDLAEHKKQVKKLKRQEDENRRLFEYKRSKTNVSLSLNEVLSSTDDEENMTYSEGGKDESDALSLEMPSTSSASNMPVQHKMNTLKLRNVAMQSIRYGVGLRATAAITTAAFIDAGLITEQDKTLVVDHNKVKRAQEKLMKSLDQEFNEHCKDSETNCIFFDGRIDTTKVLLEVDNSDRCFPSIIKEEHYSVCTEPGGRYLYHFTPKKDSRTKKHAEVIADHLVDFLKKKGFDKTLQAIGGDSTNVNTGWNGGIMHFVEVKLRRKLVWLVCALHINELPLRHLMTTLDGKTLSNNKWTGNIGQMLENATELEINPAFTKVSIGEPLISLSDSVIDSLSTDQAYGYRIVQAIRTGELPKELALLEIGPVSHSRWLTTANRLCRIWVSKHGLKGETLQNLTLIVQYIVGVYFPCWFQIKVKHSWIEAPRHVLLQLHLLRHQNKTVVDVVLPTVKRSAWYAFSEMVIQCLLCSDDIKERKAGVQKIVNLRGGNDGALGDLSVRPRKTPSVNPDATTLLDLIDWSGNVYEPPLTCNLMTSEVKKFINEPMEVPKWPCHGQSIERIVKQVTEAAGKVYTAEKREGFIRGQEASRRLMSRNESKQDLYKLT